MHLYGYNKFMFCYDAIIVYAGCVIFFYVRYQTSGPEVPNVTDRTAFVIMMMVTIVLLTMSSSSSLPIM